MPHQTTTLAILATVVVLLFTYQYLSTSSAVDLQDYIPLSPNSAKFGVDGVSDGLASNIQDAEDLDWDHLPEVDTELMTGPGNHAPSDMTEKRKVNVELGVMSRCPDARLCESTMDKVFSYPGIGEKVNITLSYIGRPDKRETYGVKCLHGDRECAGNIQQLCVQQHTFDSTLSPSLMEDADPEPYLNAGLPPYYSFVLAQNFIDSSRTGDLDYAKKCAEAVGVDWEESGVAQCVGNAGSDDFEITETGGEEGQQLLYQSAYKLLDLDIT
ncbi:hypothetical protein QFC21_004761 [Naganishia friedmannii]|uniref:Uncharacterized protein n=1 Tax=Naganishia friedmannii TaxID=89922 RepID=A0ACC2VF17_9TREE|nr:hypothetical protein QFC21_004761 [Naganishia friedmannii]